MNVTLDSTYEGDIIKTLLNKTIQVITGRDSGKQKEAMRKYIADMKPGDGFVSLFNGTDLTGWKGLVADPIKRAAMDAKKLTAEQQKADAADPGGRSLERMAGCESAAGRSGKSDEKISGRLSRSS